MPRAVTILLPGLLAGALTALSIPPFGFWPLGPAGLGLLAWHLWGLAAWRARALSGLAFGAALFGIGICWVTEFQQFGFVGLALLQTSFFVAAAALPVADGWRRVPAFGAAVALAEAARSWTPWGGFPMAGIPLGQSDSPLTPAARIGGTVLLTFLTAVLGAALADLWTRRRAAAPIVLAAVVAAALPVVAGRLAPDGTATGTIRLAVVQGGGIRGLRAVEGGDPGVLQRHLDESRNIQEPVDVIVWPENTVAAGDLLEGSQAGKQVAALAEEVGVPVLVGITEDVGDRFKNAQVAYGPDGQIIGRYDKVHRVPFGEYVPGRELFASIADLSLLPRDAIPGHGPGLLTLPGGQRLGVVISYEVFFGDRARAAARAGAQVLLAPTNAASYKTSQVPDQELAASRLRAWETGLDVVQAAPTGFSAFVTPRGHVTDKTDLSAKTHIVRTLQLRHGQTPYTRTGTAPWVALSALVLAAATGVRSMNAVRRRRRAP